MSLSTQTPQTPAAKTVNPEFPLDRVPSSLGLALSGSRSSLKPVSHSIKVTDPSALDPDNFRRISTSTVSGLSDDGRSGRSNFYVPHSRYTSRSPASPTTWRAAFQHFWQRNRGLWLVTISQFFGALMNVTTRLLELEGDGMHPFQVLFIRMSITVVLCCAYMWYTKVPYFPLGMKEVRWLLVTRGLSGFFGIFGMYYSLLYLPLSDATVITFLSPTLAGYGCYLFFGERFTRIEQIASIVSLAGVVLIARPTSFFHLAAATDSISSHSSLSGQSNSTTAPGYDFPTPTSAQRLSAIGIGLLGVTGAAVVFTCIRWIGQRAHPLISVNYFSVWCTLVSILALSTAAHLPYPFTSPNLHFAFPASAKRWGMLVFLGTCGFIMQFMMTAGMAHEKSNRATNMVYTNMLFALCFDRWVFGTSPALWSLLGSGLILGSAVYVALQKGAEGGTGVGEEVEAGVVPDEERGMLEDMCGVEDGSSNGGGVQLRDIAVRVYDEELDLGAGEGTGSRVG